MDNNEEIMRNVAQAYAQSQFELMKNTEQQNPQFSWKTHGEEIFFFPVRAMYIALGQNTEEQAKLEQIAGIEAKQWWNMLVAKALEQNETLPLKVWSEQEIIESYINSCSNKIVEMQAPYRHAGVVDYYGFFQKTSFSQYLEFINASLAQQLSRHFSMEQSHTIVQDKQEDIERRALQRWNRDYIPTLGDLRHFQLHDPAQTPVAMNFQTRKAWQNRQQ